MLTCTSIFCLTQSISEAKVMTQMILCLLGSALLASQAPKASDQETFLSRTLVGSEKRWGWNPDPDSDPGRPSRC